MPNYYIQATRGHFNPLSFDELVKPLNMYKEYYDENEKAVTEMRSQADLWDEIMKSEGDTDLANKYNQYSQGLNDAAQQLSNGMSYNLRKQIQDLRAKSAMVKQIENAYTLRAKDIDTYNELMMKDPSRIGAFDPSQRRLQEYMQGPVTNEYGVSGDRLYSLGNARAKAMSAQNVNYYNSIMTNGGQYFMDLKTQGFSDENIAKMLREQDSALYNEASRIMQQEDATFNNQADMDRAVGYTINGMLSGFSYDEDRKYRKNENYMNDYERLKAQYDLMGKYLDNKKKAVEIAKNFGIDDPRKYFQALIGENAGLFSTQLPKDFTENEFDKILNKWATGNDNKEGYQFNNNGEFTTKSIADYNKLSDNQKQELTNYVDDFLTRNNGDEYSAIELIARRNDLKELFGNKNMSDSELNKYIDLYKDAQKDKQNISAINSFVDSYNIPGSSKEEQYINLLNFINESSQIKNYGGLWFKNSTELNNVKSVLKNLIDFDSGLTLISENGDKIDKNELQKLMKKDTDIKAFPAIDGIRFNINGEEYSIGSTDLNLFKQFNDSAFDLSYIIKNPFDYIDNYKKTNNIYESKPDDRTAKYSTLSPSNMSYYLYKNKNGELIIHLLNITNGATEDIKMFDVNDWNEHAQQFVNDFSEQINEISN